MMWRVFLLVTSASPLASKIFLQAQETAGGGGTDINWISYLLNGGPFAIVVFLLVTDKLTTPGERDRLRVELTAAHAREEKLNENIRNDIVPMMALVHEAATRSTEATERIINVLVEDKAEKG